MTPPRRPLGGEVPRRPPHFKVFTSIQNHHKTLGVFDDDALLAMYVRAGILAVERFADQTGDSFLVSTKDLERLAGCRGVANAERKLGRLGAESPLTVGREGAGWRLTFPNFAKKQFGREEKRKETGPPSSSTSSPSSTSSQDTPKPPCAPRSVPRANGALEVAWQSFSDAFALYDRRAPKLTPGRRRDATRRLEEHPERGPDVLAQIAHGYFACHPEIRPGYDPWEHFHPETLFRPGNAAKYLEAYDQAVAAGRLPPFPPRRELSRAPSAEPRALPPPISKAPEIDKDQQAKVAAIATRTRELMASGAYPPTMSGRLEAAKQAEQELAHA